MAEVVLRQRTRRVATGNESHAGCVGYWLKGVRTKRKLEEGEKRMRLSWLDCAFAGTVGPSLSGPARGEVHASARSRKKRQDYTEPSPQPDQKRHFFLGADFPEPCCSHLSTRAWPAAFHEKWLVADRKEKACTEDPTRKRRNPILKRIE